MDEQLLNKFNYVYIYRPVHMILSNCFGADSNRFAYERKQKSQIGLEIGQGLEPI